MSLCVYRLRPIQISCNAQSISFGQYSIHVFAAHSFDKDLLHKLLIGRGIYFNRIRQYMLRYAISALKWWAF